MGLMDLPEEILIIITRQLDTKSAHNLYKTCRRMKNIIAMHGVMRVCNLSVSTLATAKSLQLEMVKLISNHLFELNMSGVQDLTKNLLLAAVKKMKCLKTLNVAYTKINLLDVTDIFMNCPTIRNITINFQFQNPEMTIVPTKILDECQEAFKNFRNVHFVLKSWYSNLPLYTLRKSSINILKYTICDWQGAVYQHNMVGVYNKEEIIDSMVPFNHFCMFMLNWELGGIYQGTWNLLLPLVNLAMVEFIIIEYDTSYSLCTSQMFRNFFSENFHITSFLDLQIQKPLHGNVAILIWNKETTVFDELFFLNLKKRIKAIFACEIKVTNEEPSSLGVAARAYERFHFNLVQAAHNRNRRADDTGPEFKKRRMVQTTETLNYDSTFKELASVKLNMFFTDMCIVTLSANSEYLRKLTYLSLMGATVRYSNEFFNILFRCCDNLVTLNVEAPAVSPCCSPIMRSIPLSRSIKNIRLADRRIDFNMLFSSFSQCTTLENICIIDISSEFNNLADPTTVFKKCSNLYCLYIRAAMSERLAMKKLRMLNKSKTNCSKHCLNLTLHNSHEYVKSGYNPYMHVFNLKPIKPV